MKFKVEKKLRAIFLIEYKLDHKATEASRNINKTFGQETANEHTAQHCVVNRLVLLIKVALYSIYYFFFQINYFNKN